MSENNSMLADYIAEFQDQSNMSDLQGIINLFLMMAGEFVILFTMTIFQMTKDIVPFLMSIFGFFIVGAVLNYIIMSKKLAESTGKIYIDANIRVGSDNLNMTFDVIGYEYIILPSHVGLKKISYNLEKIEVVKGRVRDTINIIGPNIYTHEYMESRERENIYNIQRIRDDNMLNLINLFKFIVFEGILIGFSFGIFYTFGVFFSAFMDYIRLFWGLVFIIANMVGVRKIFLFSEKDLAKYKVEYDEEETIDKSSVIKEGESEIAEA